MDLLSSDSEEERNLQTKSAKKTSAKNVFSDLRVNQKFASELERRERYKDFQRAKEISLDDEEESDSESDESEDDDAELLSPGLDVKILQTINLLKKKDPKIYDPNTKWFSDPSDDEEDESSDEEGASSTKKQRYKDIVRQQLLKDGADDDDSDAREQNQRDDGERTKKSQLLYNKEQEDLRKQFLNAAKTGEKEVESDSEDGEMLLQVKHKTKAEREEEECAYQQALAEMKELEGNKEADDAAFLHQFLSKKMWKDPTSNNSAMHLDDVEIEDDEDEKAFDEAERFESKYNFRFEELQDNAKDEVDENDIAGRILFQQSRNQVVGHARNVADSVRRVDDKRKQQRETRKEKKEKEKRQKEAELKRLKNLKKQELQGRLAKISEMGGLKELGIDENFLDEDWDPEKYEKLMAQQFNDSYYDDENGDDLAAIRRQGADEDGMFDEDGQYNVYENAEGNVLVDDEMGNEDNYAEEDPAVTKESVSQMMDEYYALDYEDIVAGIPCRFKYRSVEPEGFGLTTEDILLAEDQELNHYLSLKKLAPYNYGRSIDGSGKDLSKKRKRLRAAARERLEAEEAAQQAAAAKSAARKEKKDKQEAVGSIKAENKSEGEGEGKKRKRRKRKHKEGRDEKKVDSENDDE